MENTARQAAKRRELCAKRETLEFRHRIFRPSSDETASIVLVTRVVTVYQRSCDKKRNAETPEGKRSKGRCGEREAAAKAKHIGREKK